MRDLRYPAVVLPTHWDNFLVPHEASQQPALDALQSLLKEIAAASPKTKVIVPKYFQPIPFGEVSFGRYSLGKVGSRNITWTHYLRPLVRG